MTRSGPLRGLGLAIAGCAVLALGSGLAPSQPCLGTNGPVAAAEYGKALFSDPAFSESRSNAFSCATCHTVTKDGDPARLNSGYSLFDVASRPSWWGSYEARLGDAVDFCYIAFMRGLGPLDHTDPKSKALFEYLVSISPDGVAPALPMTIVKDIADVPRGDAARGAAVYRAACAICHGDLHTGKGRITDRAVILPEFFATYASSTLRDFPTSKVVIEKIRHGQFFMVGGNMPLYTTEALSDADLGALLSYLGI